MSAASRSSRAQVLVKLLDKFDPKSDGADRSYADIYDESAKLLYEEIDYTLEGKNGARFAASLKGIGLDYIKVPDVFWEVTNERVLTMEFVESFKLTDMAKVEAAGLDKALLADRVADSFLAQILKTGYFHCDPHPGNLCVNQASAQHPWALHRKAKTGIVTRVGHGKYRINIDHPELVRVRAKLAASQSGLR